MDASQQSLKNASHTLNARYIGTIVTYSIFLLLLIFNYSIRSTVFVGIVMGSIFPFISFLYLHKNYISERKKIPIDKIRQISVLSWALPTFFLHVIIIFGFNITINGPLDSGFKSSLYSSSYKYSKVFEGFTEKNITSFEENQDKLKNYVTFYASFFSDVKREKKQTRLQQFFNRISGEKKEESKSENSSKLDKRESSVSPHETSSTPSTEEEYSQLIKELSDISAPIARIPFFIAVTFSFLGALIFCLSDAINRYTNIDLYPKVYIFYVIRFIISGSLAVALSSFIMTDFPVILAPFIFLGIGYFPERAIKYIDDKMTQYFGIKSMEYKSIPLSFIQGLSPQKALRFREVGIEDVQHLAFADIEFLEKNLPYNKKLLCDWMAQSILYLQFPDNVELLKKLGIRTILQLKDFDLESQQVKKQIANENIGKRELGQLEYLKYVVSLPQINDRLCKLIDTVKAD